MINKDESKLTAFVLGELSADERAEIEQAIAASPELKREVDEIRETISLLKAGFSAEEDAEPAVQTKPTVETANATRHISHRWLVIAVTAACLLILVGGIHFSGLDWRGRFGFSQASNVETDLDKIIVENKSLDELVAEFNELIGEGRYAEAEIVAREASELYPGTEQVLVMKWKSKFIRRLRSSDPSPYYQLDDVENSRVDADEILISFPDAETWEELVKMRQKYHAVELSPEGEVGRINLNTVDSDELQRHFAERMLSSSSMRAEVSAIDMGDEDETVDTRGSLTGGAEIGVGRWVLRGSGVLNGGDDVRVEILPNGSVIVAGPPENQAQVDEMLERLGPAINNNGSPTGSLDIKPENFSRRLAEQQFQEQMKKEIETIPKQENDKPKSWKRVAAIPNTSRLMVGDKHELAMQGMQVRVKVDGFRARVILDCLYYNDRDQQLEGTFKLRLPNDASLYYFAFGESVHQYAPDLKPEKLREEIILHEFPGKRKEQDIHKVSFSLADIRADREGSWDKVKEARVVPQEKAAFAYGETVRRKIDPALVEWAGAGVFNAKVFPLVSKRMHRIVIGYDVNLQNIDDKLVYQLDLPKETGTCKVDLDFSTSDVRVSRSGNEIAKDDSLLKVEPQIESGRAHFHFDNPQAKTLRFELAQPANLLLVSPSKSDDKFFATSITPDLPTEEVAGSKQAIFMVDTSLSSNPDKFNAYLAMLRTTLDSNRDALKQFAVCFFDVDSYWWEKGYTENTPENVERLLAYCQTVSLEGATDLHAAFFRIAHTDWLKQYEQADLFLLSDAAATWGETNLAQINRQLELANVGSLFAYQTGLTGTDSRALQLLAQKHGGAVFNITNEAEIASAATAHRKRPWLLKSMVAGDASDLLVAGRVEAVYPGQTLLIVGRGAPDKEITLEFVRGDEQRSIRLPIRDRIESELAERVYGQVAVGQLESLGRFTEDVSVAYARHFRVPGETCSLLMLDSEEDYQRFNIKPEDDRFVVNSSKAGSLIEKKLAAIRDQLADPKAELIAWLERLEKAETLKFKLPTALRIAIDDIPQGAFEVNAFLPACKLRTRPDGTAIDIVKLAESYDAIQELAKSRRSELGTPDALRTLSNLVEQNPGNHVLSRDIAFTAMQWDQPAAAYYLLRRVALSRPYEGHVYTALGHCLAQLEQTELAMIFYEVAINSSFPQTGADFGQIATVEYVSMLKDIVEGRRMTAIPEYARSRYESLKSSVGFDSADLVVSMMWNTDRSDVDLHVVEPSGEECFYEHRDTQTGGHITQDITTGFGPEMYTLKNAPAGIFTIKAKYYGSDAIQSGVRAKVLLTIYEHFGTDNQTERRETVTLEKTGDVVEVAKVKIAK